MDNKSLPIVSIMIATFNSAHVLPKTLEAIVNQDYPREKLDIMVIDGGSTDETLSIAKKFDCRIIDNPMTEPGNAKFIGIREAKGRYLATIDHDEVLLNKKSIIIKMDALQSYPDCKVALCSGCLRPEEATYLNEYISEFGDPFSLYYYGFTKRFGFFEKLLRRNFKIVNETDDFFIVDFSKMNKHLIIELCYATVIDREWFVKNTDVLTNKSTLAHLFYIMRDLGHTEIVVAKNDPFEHYSVDKINKYWAKLKWRVCNNIHFPEMGEVGFTGRAKRQKGSMLKKYLFMPYAYTLIGPIIQGVYLGATRQNPSYLLHPIFCVYVATQILYQHTLKFLGKTPAFTSYDGKKKIER